MRKNRKFFSAFLAVLLLLSLFSVTAFAESGSTTLTATIPCTVTLQVGEHGKVTVDGTDYTGNGSFTEAVGTVLTYTFTPNTLYKEDKVIYNGTDVTGELSGNTYTAPAILALTMLACMSVTAFAADGTTVLTVEVPDNKWSYTIHIPKDTTLEYGNTDYQKVGEVYVSDVKNLPSDSSFIWWDSEWSDLSNGSHTIPLDGYVKKSDGDFYWLDPLQYWRACTNDASHSPLIQEVYAKVDSWEGAVPGTTYTATVSFPFLVIKQ